MRLRAGSVLALVMATCWPAIAHTQPVTAATAHRIDAIGRAAVASGRTAGLAIGVVEDGRIVYAHGFGYANRAKHLPAGPATEFYVGQLTEPFTAAAVLLLAQEGKLKLTDRVTRYLPSLTVAGSATIAQLLQQTSGLPHLSSAPGIPRDRRRAVRFADMVATVDKLHPDFAPGSRIEYNDLNYYAAGRIVESVSGLPLSDFLQAHIFQPLYMSSTFYAGDTGIAPDHALGYTGSARRLALVAPWTPSRLQGARGLVTNVYDLAKWDIEMPILLRVDAIRDMFTASGASGAQAYGMGWVVDQRDGNRFIWIDGEVAGYHAMNALLPDDNVAVIVLTNTDDLHGSGTIEPEAITGEILDMLVPPRATHLNSLVTERAREWLHRLQARNIDRTQLTPEFSAYLTDRLVAQANFRQYGKILAFFPTASFAGQNGGTIYEFFVRFAHGHFHFRFGLTPQNKIDELLLTP